MSLDNDFNHRTELLATGRTYHFVDQAPEGTPQLLPASSAKLNTCRFGWRKQIKPWVSKGYQVIVPTTLGYGGTDKPADPAEYTTKKVSDDLVAILDLLGVDKVVIIGHDRGSGIASRFTLWHPTRVSGLVLLSIPFLPLATQYTPLEDQAKRFPQLGYQLYFSSPESTKEIESKLDLFLALVYQDSTTKNQNIYSLTSEGAIRKALADPSFEFGRPIVLEPWELGFYKSQFETGGMEGPLSYYRTTRNRYEEEKDLAANFEGFPEDLPVLFLMGAEEIVKMQDAIENQPKIMPKLERDIIPNAGHWVMVEAAETVTNRIADWIERNIVA